MFFLGGEPTPEMKAEIERRHQLSHMAEENARHEENRFLAELSEDQLQFLDKLIGSCMFNKKYASYMRGRIDGVLLARDNHCPCGKTHEAPEDFHAVAEVSEDESPFGKDGCICPSSRHPANGHEEKCPKVETPFTPSTAEENAALMEEYGMELVDDPLMPGRQVLRCANCKMPSVSMEDRMLRAPKVEGCNGCQIKEGHG